MNKQLAQQVDELEFKVKLNEGKLEELKTHLQILQQALLAVTRRS